NLWERQYMYENDDEAVALFRQGKFALVRKAPSKILSMRRPVYDNDHPAKDLLNEKYPPRWAPERDAESSNGRRADFRRNRERAQEDRAWLADDAHGFRHADRTGPLAWLRYRHLVVDRPGSMGLAQKPPAAVAPELITDFLGYDTWQPQSPGNFHSPPPPNWVGDLILECDVAADAGEGADRHFVM